ncbi:MAG: hypothetical protein AAF602_12670 [Myxococcota bacterium]
MTRVLLSTTLLVLAACDGDEGGAFVQVDPPDLVIPTGPVDTGDATCGPTQLCERSIDECGVALDQASCEAWYDSGECRDVASYTSCNCDCEATEDTCDGYFSCGQLCFLDFCEA